MQKHAKKLGAFSVIVCAVVVCAIFLFGKYMKKNPTDGSANKPKTEVEKLLAKDLEQGYPETPKEVMNLYCRYLQLIYKNELTDENLSEILDKARVFYAAELIKVNSKENQLTKLHEELKDFSSNRRSIVSYSVDKSTNVKYKTINGKECALVVTSFLLSEKKGYSKTFEQFVLQKESNQWKILGFEKTKSQSENIDSQEEEK